MRLPKWLLRRSHPAGLLAPPVEPLPSQVRWRIPEFSPPRTIAASDAAYWPWGLKLGGIDRAWLKSKGAGVRWAVLDTGIDAAHVDFSGRLAAMRDFSGSAYGTDDRSGHGTHTAGTVGAADNGRGAVGVAPEVELVIGKVLGDDGSGSTAMIAQGVDWALEQGVSGISLSLVSPYADPALRAALLRATARGVFVVGAAGNDGPRLNSVGYPGKWQDVSLTVGAVDEQGALADFSSRGPEVDCCGPGVGILSCWPGGGYAVLSGTSMATPFVAGAIALMISYRKSKGLPTVASQAELEAEIRRTALHVGGKERVDDWGWGIFSAEAILADAPIASVPDGPVSFGPFTLGGYSWLLTATPAKP